MSLPSKSRWTIRASSGQPAAVIDDLYADTWLSESATTAWLEIDLGEVVTLGGIEVYWGRRYAEVYGFEMSVDGRQWRRLCQTRHGEGGQNVFAFPPVEARFLRLQDQHEGAERSLEIVEINLYAPAESMSVREPGALPVLGQGPVTLAPGASITVDFGYVRSPLGALIDWGQTHGTVFSVHLSDDGESFREVGRITTSHGDYDNFYWRSTTARYFRLTLHEASSPEGAVIDELKLRILNKDRMPIGQLERAALGGRGELYPQSLLGRQVYWTALGEPGVGDQALFDEYGNLEPRPGSGQFMPLLRLDGHLYGASAATSIAHGLAEGSMPIPSVTWQVGGVELRVTALAEEGAAWVEYRITAIGAEPLSGSLVLAVRPVQINPYWQHGGHAAISAIDVEGRGLRVNDRPYAEFSAQPDAACVAEFDHGDIVEQIANGPQSSVRSLRSGSGLLSAAVEFGFALEPGQSIAFVAVAPMRDAAEIDATRPFATVYQQSIARWRGKLGPRRISVGDRDVSDTVEAQTGLILVNATPFAFKPGPRNYDRTWIRDGSSQALALLWAGLVDEAQRYVLWYAERIYPDGMVPPILNPDGTVNRGYGSDIEFDAQGQFVTIAADTYRISRDRGFLEAVYEPALRATDFLDELVARTNALHGPDSRFNGLLAPSISHEGYNKPTYSYWDDFFALSAWRNGEFLAREVGDIATAERLRSRGDAFAADLARSLRLTAEHVGNGLLPASADRNDVDPTSSSIAFEPCRVAEVLPTELLQPTWDDYLKHLDIIRAPAFDGGFTPYEIRNLNALIALGRQEDAYRLLGDALTWQRPPGWRHWAEVVWGNPRVPEYIGDMPHTWIGAEFATAVRRMLLREDRDTLELFRAVPDAWWAGEGISLRDLPTAFGRVDLRGTRDAQRAIIELTISEGPPPQRVTLRYPGAKQALADGEPCLIEDDVIIAPVWRRLEIGF